MSAAVGIADPGAWPAVACGIALTRWSTTQRRFDEWTGRPLGWLIAAVVAGLVLAIGVGAELGPKFVRAPIPRVNYSR